MKESPMTGFAPTSNTALPSGKGKSIDSGKNTFDLLIKSVRGYGGVAIIWDRPIDQYVKPIIDGNNIIQCIELVLKNQILLVSAYLPTKAENDKFEEKFSECCKIGNININAVACADDIALLSDNPYDLQILVTHALQYSQFHYTLQPQKIIIIQVENKAKKAANQNWNFNFDNKEMPNVDKSTHLGIIR
ncbi:unnamed protein product [Mytilus coruscus]|uniref:Uncharacterized protein n=1 Tax=Mytilus coruscus TaxID=42192 RepID=A0A6J8B6R4_MYTCO|nr:unnamed protein product [Mytilus coruscus]